MQFKKNQEIYNNKRIRFSKELEAQIDKELERVRREQEANGNKTYTQEELDAIILGESYNRII
ncbi:MAG: hypothetical protein HFJ29_07605 [Clostridia bacterium]|nr:hypothetical protein [Clostridia bacterium]